jgi:hypothetical protein
VVVLANTADKDLPVSLRVDGKLIKVTLPAKSFNTLCVAH